MTSHTPQAISRAALLLVFVMMITAAGGMTQERAKHGVTRAAPSSRQRQVLDAIRHVESGGQVPVPDGDNGRAIGPYQIHRAYWIDAHAFDPQLGGTYQDCRKRAYAERVVAAYMRRYVAIAWAAGDAETIARVHNGGPRGHKKKATRSYWQRVRTRLRAVRAKSRRLTDTV